MQVCRRGKKEATSFPDKFGRKGKHVCVLLSTFFSCQAQVQVSA